MLTKFNKYINFIEIAQFLDREGKLKLSAINKKLHKDSCLAENPIYYKVMSESMDDDEIYTRSKNDVNFFKGMIQLNLIDETNITILISRIYNRLILELSKTETEAKTSALKNDLESLNIISKNLLESFVAQLEKLAEDPNFNKYYYPMKALLRILDKNIAEDKLIELGFDEVINNLNSLIDSNTPIEKMLIGDMDLN